jgi:hypothetical protein
MPVPRSPAGGSPAGAFLALVLLTAAPGPAALARGRTIPVAAGHSLGEALARAAAGDTVEVGPGSFEGGIAVPSGVVLLGAGPQRTIITRPHGQAVRIEGAGSGTRLGRLTIRTADTGLVIGGGEPVVFECWIEDCKLSGVVVSGASKAELLRSFLRNNPGDGVLVRGPGSPLIAGCQVQGSRAGIRVEGASPTVAGCEITGNQIGVAVAREAAVVLGDSRGSGNRIHKNRRANVQNLGSHPVRARYNFWGDTRCAFRRGFVGEVLYLPFMDLALETALAACP